MIFNHCVIKLAIQNALRFNNKFCSLKNTQNYIFNFIKVKIVGNIK